MQLNALLNSFVVCGDIIKERFKGLRSKFYSEESEFWS